MHRFKQIFLIFAVLDIHLNAALKCPVIMAVDIRFITKDAVKDKLMATHPMLRESEGTAQSLSSLQKL